MKKMNDLFSIFILVTLILTIVAFFVPTSLICIIIIVSSILTTVFGWLSGQKHALLWLIIAFMFIFHYNRFKKVENEKDVDIEINIIETQNTDKTYNL